MIKIKYSKQPLKQLATILVALFCTALQAATIEQSITQNPLVTQEHFGKLMNEARQAMEQKDYSRAIKIYTEISKTADSPYHKDALELLALAQERKKQLSHAIATYKKYLRNYPNGEDAVRVSQRLAALITAAKTPKKKLRKIKEDKNDGHWDIYGNFSQFYRHRLDIDSNDEKELRQSTLSSYLNVTGRSRTPGLELKSRLTANYKNDFISGTKGDSSRITTLYFDANHKRSNLSARFGRQRLNSGGVLGRFDGLLASYRLTPKTRLNFIAGMPVNYSSINKINSDKRFYGINADFGTFAENWDINSYYIDQSINGIADRRAIGGEIRYSNSGKSIFTLVDYDILYNDLNTFIFSGNWTLANRTTINIALDHRKSPTLSTENALKGQSSRTIKELLQIYNEQEIQKLAQDRTAENRTYSLGISHHLNEKLQLNADISSSTFSSTPASGGVEAYEASKSDNYSLQLVGSNLIKNGDITIIGLRYSDSDHSDTTTLNINTRYPVDRNWRLNPRVKINLIKNSRNQSDRWTTSPSLRFDYRLYKNTRLEFEGGLDRIREKLPNDTLKSSSYFLNIGYRLDF